MTVQVARHSLAERVLAAVLLCVLSPLFFLLSVLVLVTSGPPIIYRQTRVGHEGEFFTLLKFRTMIRNAESETGPVLSWHGDPRVTSVGKMLRPMHLDELPQLLNIVRGEMSFIGPRPERPEVIHRIVRELPEYTERHRIKPGITGLAQLYGGYGADPTRQLRLDLHYIAYADMKEMRRFVISNTARKLVSLPLDPLIPYDV